MNTRLRLAVAVAAMAGLMGLPATAQVGGGGAGGGAAGAGASVGGNSIGGVVRPGDLSAQVSGRTGTAGSMALRPSGVNANAGDPTLAQPGGAPGSGSTVGSGATGVRGDLGINDPFAAAGTGIGGPKPEDLGIVSVDEALAGLPAGGVLGPAGPAGGPGPELTPPGQGALNPLNPLNPMNPLNSLGVAGTEGQMGLGAGSMMGTGATVPLGTGPAGALGAPPY